MCVSAATGEKKYKDKKPSGQFLDLIVMSH
jgi:hypothetical protein